MEVDPEGKVTFLNRFGQDFFGYSEDEVRERYSVGTILPETDAKAYD